MRDELALQKAIKAGHDAHNLAQSDGWKDLCEWLRSRIEAARNALERDAKDMEAVRELRGEIKAYRLVLERPNKVVRDGEVAEKKLHGSTARS